MRPRTLAITAAVGAIAIQALGPVAPARAATPIEVPFSAIDAEQSWVVPAGVSTIHVVLIAGKGGDSTAPGGHGARVEGDLAVTPATTLYIEVAGNGLSGGSTIMPNPGGFNGGGEAGYYRQDGQSSGSGGGASDIRTTSNLDAGTLDSRLVVAAGAGGGAYLLGTAIGGDAGQAGGSANGTAGGGAGTSSAGGAGGTGTTPLGHAGVLGFGGDGADASITGLGGGGGGGGGLYGGGGGAYEGGGGGGSNLTSGLTNPSASIDATGTPSITITYTPGPAPTPSPTPGPTSGPDNGTVNVQFSVPTSAACLELSTTSIDFGSVRLGAENVAATPDVVVTNCSGIAEDILARGSDATATGTNWSLVGGSATCADTLGLNSYRMALESATGTVGLSTSNATLGSLAGGDTSTQTARMWAACPGSDGAGQLMTSQITFLATEGS